eukprot:GHVS01002152.1.p1 GENE.GHVS01002152.1~~GHVS01002152.1.p1  ORF type:complete len:290 (-),score=53.00 GHVS01002152.1:697-1566(-)
MSSSSSPRYPCRRYEGQLCVVTAGTAGIGLAIAKRLALEGGHVLLSSRKHENVQTAVTHIETEGRRYHNEVSVKGIVCHVGNGQDRKKLLDEAIRWKQEIRRRGSEINRHEQKEETVDVLVCNAAVSPYVGESLETPERSVDKLFETNVKASFLLVQLFHPYLQTLTGSVLLVSSYLAFNPMAPIGFYGVTKTALAGLTKMLSNELSAPPRGIRVNCLAPGVVKTNFSRAMWETDDGTNTGGIRDLVVMKRFAEADEMSGVAAFLCSHQDASYVTGEVVVASGGMPSRL